MTDKLTGLAFRKRQAIWQHNGLLGHHRRAFLFLMNVIHSPSTTVDAKFLAGEAMQFLIPLEAELRKRDDKSLNTYLTPERKL